MRKGLKALLAVVCFASVTAAFLGVPYTLAACRIQPAVSWAFLVVLLLTPLVGRLFCETLCPLGLLQSLVSRLFHPRRAVRRVCTRLPVTRPQGLVRGAVLLAFVLLVLGGLGGVAALLSPYALYGKALTALTAATRSPAAFAGLFLVLAILVLALFGQGRLWCNWVCPAGTLFTLLARKSVCAHKVGPGCSNCRRCFGGAPVGAPAAARRAEGAEGGVTRRETLSGVISLAAVETLEKTTDGGYASVSLPGANPRAASVLPPGAGSHAAFARLCIACGLCLEKCPAGVLKASTRLATFGQPEMDFRGGSCLMGCGYRCATACPVNALERRRLTARGSALPHANVHVGYAVYELSRCLRTTEKVSCTACVRKCPVKAIHLVEGFPVVDRQACIGCGACEHVCPARPLSAIVVNGLEVQRIVRPMEG